jgi:hypothetical protein
MPVLKVEHFACNVSDPAGMAAWYVEHSGMRILRRNAAPPHIGDELVERRAAILRAAHAVGRSPSKRRVLLASRRGGNRPTTAPQFH